MSKYTHHQSGSGEGTEQRERFRQDRRTSNDGLDVESLEGCPVNVKVLALEVFHHGSAAIEEDCQVALAGEVMSIFGHVISEVLDFVGEHGDLHFS